LGGFLEPLQHWWSVRKTRNDKTKETSFSCCVALQPDSPISGDGTVDLATSMSVSTNMFRVRFAGFKCRGSDAWLTKSHREDLPLSSSKRRN